MGRNVMASDKTCAPGQKKEAQDARKVLLSEGQTGAKGQFCRDTKDTVSHLPLWNNPPPRFADLPSMLPIPSLLRSFQEHYDDLLKFLTR
ncbi:RNA polymerase sigma factor, partial [Pseudomonas idahonensis]